MAETINCAGSDPGAYSRLDATPRAAFTACQPSGATTRMLSARRKRAVPAGAVPPGKAPSQSSAAVRSAAVMSSRGSGRSAGATPASAGVETWPTPTTTGVRGSRAMVRGAYWLPPRRPGGSQDRR